MAAEAYPWDSNEDYLGLGTEPIPAAPYYRPEYFELEREAIFRRSWLVAGHVCELPEPGSYVVRNFEVLPASALIVRGEDGEIRAFHNVCTHRGTQLVDGEGGKRRAFPCRYHGWTYALDGQLRGAPDFERFHLDAADCGLRPVALEVCAGLLFVNFSDPPPQSLSEYLGPVAGELEELPVARATHFAEYVYEIDANWKITYDNFQENYHLRYIHPKNVEGAVAPENPFGYPAGFQTYGPHRSQQIWVNPNMEPKACMAAAFGKLAMLAAKEGYLEKPQSKEYYGVFPNYFILGNPAQHFHHFVMPLGPRRSRGVIRLYWVGYDDCASTRFAREFSMATVRDVHSEDRDVVEAGQRGLESGAIEHVHYQSQEVLLRHFFHEVNGRVEAYRRERRAAGSGS